MGSALTAMRTRCHWTQAFSDYFKKQHSGDHFFCDAHECISTDNQIKTSLMLYKRTIVSGVKFPVTTSYAESQVLYLKLCKWYEDGGP